MNNICMYLIRVFVTRFVFLKPSTRVNSNVWRHCLPNLQVIAGQKVFQTAKENMVYIHCVNLSIWWHIQTLTCTVQYLLQFLSSVRRARGIKKMHYTNISSTLWLTTNSSTYSLKPTFTKRSLASLCYILTN